LSLDDGFPICSTHGQRKLFQAVAKLPSNCLIQPPLIARAAPSGAERRKRWRPTPSERPRAGAGSVYISSMYMRAAGPQARTGASPVRVNPTRSRGLQTSSAIAKVRTPWTRTAEIACRGGSAGHVLEGSKRSQGSRQPRRAWGCRLLPPPRTFSLYPNYSSTQPPGQKLLYYCSVSTGGRATWNTRQRTGQQVGSGKRARRLPVGASSRGAREK
jgi:hypothetical protein